DDKFGAASGNAESFDIGVEVVGDGCVPTHGDANFRQAATKPLTVRVQILAARQLAADGDDFTFHARFARRSKELRCGEDHYRRRSRARSKRVSLAAYFVRGSWPSFVKSA